MKQVALILLVICSNFFPQFRHSNYHALPHSTNDSIKFIDTSHTISTVADLLKKVKGKPVFIDLWASWCEPCLDEFKESADLNKWLKHEGITRLYVSFDGPKNCGVWTTTITEYHLNGYHIMANKNLQDDFSRLIWGAPGGYSLPHYLLVDKGGRILEKDAISPSLSAQAKHQIMIDLELEH